jgi:hypothetical protein
MWIYSLVFLWTNLIHTNDIALNNTLQAELRLMVEKDQVTREEYIEIGPDAVPKILKEFVEKQSKLTKRTRNKH